MYNEKNLAQLSYRELQVLAAQHRVPGNIKKHTMIKVILAARRGDESEVTRVLNELQQTRKKRVKKVKKDIKTIMQSTMRHHSNYQENRYYARQLKPSFHCESNLQILAKEEISNHDGEQQRISNYDNVHEYFIQRDYHYNIDNNYNQHGGNSSSIVDLRINEQKSVIHQTLPLDLHRATNILLSPTYNHDPDNIDNTNYHFLDPNDSLQAPLLLKKMLQAPAGTNLKEYAGPDGIKYRRVYSRNNYSQSNFYDDSDTLTAESESNDNDDVGNTNENLYCIMNSDKSQLIHADQNLIGSHNEQNINTINQTLTNITDHFRMGYQLSDTQQNCQKWLQQSSATLVNNVSEIDQDNAEIFKSLYYSNRSSLQNHNDIMQADQSQSEAFNNCSIMTINNSHNTNNDNCNSNNNNESSNYYYYNNESRVESSNSSTQQIVYNCQNENNSSAIMNNNMQNNHDNVYYNQQNNSDDTSGYNSQLYSIHDTEVFNNIYPNADISSQQFNHDIDGFVGFNNQSGVDNARNNNNECYYNDIYSQSYQIGVNADHNESQSLANNQYQQYVRNRESHEIGMNQTTQYGDLESYFPRWKQSAITSVIHKNLENLLNIRKYNQLDEPKTNETSSVFCYAAPIITPKQLAANANVCTQEKRFVVEKRKNSLLKINSNQVYNDTAQGRKMANVMKDLTSNSTDPLDIISNNNISLKDENFNHNDSNEIDSNTSMNDLWTIDRSNVSCDTQTETIE